MALGAVFGAATALAISGWLPGSLRAGFQATPAGAALLWIGLGASAMPAAALCALLIARSSPTHPLYVARVGTLWACLEIGWGYGFPGLPWIVLGATAIDSPFAPLASLLGVHGVSGAAAAVQAWAVQFATRAPLRAHLGSALVCGALAALLCCAAHSAAPRQVLLEPLHIAAVQPGLPMQSRLEPDYARAQLDALLIETAAVIGADLVVWPESAFIASPQDTRAGARVQRFVDRHEIAILAGAARVEGTRTRVSALLFEPGIRARWVYDKRRPLMLAEWVPPGLPAALRRALGRLVPVRSVLAGSRESLQTGRLRGVAVSICYEAIYQDAAPPDAALILNLANDGWYDDGPGARQHLLLARWRAFEGGRPLLRAATTGISAFVGPDGSLVSQLAIGARGAIESRVSLGRLPSTPFTRLGNWPLAGLALLLGALWLGSCRAQVERMISSRRPRI